MRCSRLFFLVLLLSTCVYAGDGLLKQKIGGRVTDIVSSHGQTFVAQGSHLITLSWDSDKIPSIYDISQQLDGWVKHLHVSGDTLWVSSASRFERGHIYEFSLSDSRAPRFIKEWRVHGGTMPNWGILYSVGNLLYVGGYNGVITGYRTVESELRLVFQMEPGESETDEPAWLFRGFERWGDGLLMAIVQHGSRYNDRDAQLRMHMLDVSNPAEPAILAQATASSSEGFARYGQKVAALGDGHFRFFDWSDPSQPRKDFFGNIYPYYDLSGALFRNDYFISFRNRGVRVHRLSTSQSLEKVAAIAIDGMSGQFITHYARSPYPEVLLFGTKNAELAVIDVSETAEPKPYYLLDLLPGEDIRAVRDAGESIVALSDYGLFGLSRDLEPTWSFPRAHNSSRFTDLAGGDDWLLAGRWLGPASLLTLDSLGVQTQLEVGHGAEKIWRDGNRVWFLDEGLYPFLKLYDIGDPAAPEFKWSYVLESARGAAVRRRSDVLYLANRGDGIGVARLDGEDGIELIQYIQDCDTLNLDVQEALLVAACVEEGVRIYDISQPDNPKFIDAVESAGSPRSLLIDGELLWYSTYRKVHLYDISDPSRPLEMSRSAPWSMVSSVPWSGGARFWPERTGRLASSADGGVWVSAGAEGIAELNGVSSVSHSHTGAWHDPAQPGQGLVLEVLSGIRALVTWFEYDSRGMQEWYQGVGSIQGHRVEVDEVYRTQGGAFADPETSVTSEAVASARLVFHDCDTGVAEMDFGSETRISQLEPLARTMGIGCRLSRDSVMDETAELTGSWYDPDLSGQGVSLMSLSNGRMLLNWFTYDSVGESAWIQGVGDEVDGQLIFSDLHRTYASRNGIRFDPGALRVVPWGEAILDLDCLEGELSWQSTRGDFGAGAMPIKRLTIPLGLDCDL